MRFNWNEANISHIARHDVLPEEAEQVVERDALEIGRVERNGELRIVLVGETDAGRILLVAVTYRDEQVRVVTAYTANRKIRAFYLREKANNERDIDDT